MSDDRILAGIASIRAVALDLDGVVYHGEMALPGACQGVQDLRYMGLELYFVTNNSASNPREIADKLSRMGIPADEEEVFTSSRAVASYLNRLASGGVATAFVIGSESLKNEIESVGVRIVKGPPCDYLVVGLDKKFNYQKLCTAIDSLALGALFVACNRDPRFPVENGRFLPGCGAIVASIESAACRPPDMVIGKPNTTLLEMLSEYRNLRPEHVVVVGDSPASDIQMAHRFGSPSVLICGVSPSAEGAINEAMLQPTAILGGLWELPCLLKSAIGM